MPTCVIEFIHHITYIRSCFIHVSTCSQQPLHSFIITLLTRHIQWSCVVLLRSEGTKLKNIYVSHTETWGEGGWKSSIHGDDWVTTFSCIVKMDDPPPPPLFLRLWYNHLRVHYSNTHETTGLMKDWKRDGTTHKYSSLQINHVCTHVASPPSINPIIKHRMTSFGVSIYPYQVGGRGGGGGVSWRAHTSP